MFISMADLQGYLKKVLDAKKQRGCCKIAAIYKIWHSGLKNPIHIWYISCMLQQSRKFIKYPSPPPAQQT